MEEIDPERTTRQVVRPGIEGSLLLGLFMLPLAALAGVGAGLLIATASDPNVAVPVSMAVALGLLAWRVGSVHVTLADDRVDIGNLFARHQFRIDEVRAVSGGSFSGAGRPVPVVLLVTGSGAVVKLLATVRVNRSAREQLAALVQTVAPADREFVRYLEF